MARGRPVKIKSLHLSNQDVEKIMTVVSDFKTSPKVKDRCQILLKLNQGWTIDQVVNSLHISRDKCYRLYKNFLSRGIDCIYDLERTGRPILYNEEEKSFIRKIACQKPCNVVNGPNAVQWDLLSLTNYLREYGVKQGFHQLKNLVPSSLYQILSKSELTMHVKELQAPVESQNEIVLCLYKRLEFIVSSTYDYNKQENRVMLSYKDEPDNSLQYANYYSNSYTNNSMYGYKRDTRNFVKTKILSLMTGINVLSGQICVYPCFRHNPENFCSFLEILIKRYQKEKQINLIIDHHRVHDSNQVHDFIKTTKLKINFLYDPSQTLLINCIENIFSKLMRLNLSNLYANSNDELIEQINSFVERLNNCPKANRWENNAQDLSLFFV